MGEFLIAGKRNSITLIKTFRINDRLIAVRKRLCLENNMFRLYLT